MPESMVRAIHDALEHPDPRQSVEATVELAAALINSADANVRVKKTGHFNNTFIPDLVLDWPRDSRAKRDVFLRTTQDPEWLRDDVGLVPPRESMVMTLDQLKVPASETTSATSAAIDTESSERDIFVTEAETVEDFAEASSAGSVALFSSALLKGGRGFIESSRSSAIVNSVLEGVAGAQTAGAERTASLLQTADTLLNRTEDQRLTEVLQALWVGGGGAPSQFPPSETEARAELDPASLRFLLLNEDLTDPSFWPRLARTITLQTLLDLRDVESSSSLNALMSAAISTFTAKVCFIRAAPVAQVQTSPYWTLSDGQLILIAGDSSFYLSQRPRGMAALGEPDSVPSPAGLLNRLKQNHYEITEILASDGSRSVRMADAGSDLAELDTKTLDAFFVGEAKIKRVAVLSPRRRSMTLVPDMGRVAARTNSTLYLGDLIECAATVLGGIEGDALVEIASMVDAGRPQTLPLSEGAADLAQGAETDGPEGSGTLVGFDTFDAFDLEDQSADTAGRLERLLEGDGSP